MSNPYLIGGPALISFSGGRTSGFMLYHILDAYDGQLPDDVYVCFSNTGKEREETLRFVHECATRWGVRVRWLEWRPRPKGERAKFEEVGFNSADREGRTFAELIRRKQYLPNPVMRYCTIELKIRVMRDFMIAQGYQRWTNATGLRADEMHRVFKTIERNLSGKERFRTVCPMATAKHRLIDVQRFWAAQPFDLALRPHEGNCDLCFLKGRDKRAAIIREQEGLAAWWIEQEGLAAWWIEQEGLAKCSKPGQARFRKDESYAQLVAAVRNSPLLPLEDDGDEFDAECGTWCPGAAA